MKISIVTISFNQAHYLQEAIDSVQAGPGDELQYVVVDPGSTDGSRGLIHACRDRFSSMVLEKDDGPADGLNRGFARCDGDIFGYLNADDRYPPGALSTAARFFEEHPDCDVLFGAITILDGAGKPSWRKRTPDEFRLDRYAEHACNVWCPSTFFRREAFERVGGFNARNRTCWDGELAADFALAGCRLARTNQVLGEFRIYAGSITGSRRLHEAYLADRARIREKIYRSGVPRSQPWAARWMRLAYRFNVARHVRYLLPG